MVNRCSILLKIAENEATLPLTSAWRLSLSCAAKQNWPQN